MDAAEIAHSSFGQIAQLQLGYSHWLTHVEPKLTLIESALKTNKRGFCRQDGELSLFFSMINEACGSPGFLNNIKHGFFFFLGGGG